jgi:hypothetical protein
MGAAPLGIALQNEKSEYKTDQAGNEWQYSIDHTHHELLLQV